MATQPKTAVPIPLGGGITLTVYDPAKATAEKMKPINQRSETGKVTDQLYYTDGRRRIPARFRRKKASAGSAIPVSHRVPGSGASGIIV